MSPIDVEERLRRFAEAEVTDDAEAVALARLRLFISRRAFLAHADVTSGRRVFGIIGGASLIAAAGTAGAVALTKHGGGTARAPQPAVSPSPPVAATPSATAPPSATPPPTSTPAPTPTPAPPLGVYPAIDQLVMVSAKEGWAVAHGKVVRTTDGAVSWTDATPSGLTLPAGLTNPSTAVEVAALDAGHAWVYNAPRSGSAPPGDAYVFRTIDGGRTWTRVAVAGTLSLAAATDAFGPMDFVSPSVGFLLINRGGAAGSSGAAVFRTTDGGATWELMSETDTTASGDFYTTPTRGLPLPGYKDGIGFRDAQNGWVTASGGATGSVKLYVTRDGGVHWQAVRLSPPAGPQSGAVVEAATPPRFLSSQIGFLDAEVGAAQGLVRAIYATQDGGATWTGHLVTAGAGAAQAVTASLSVAIGADGTLYSSNDGGVHWSSTGPHPRLAGSAAPHFVDARIGFVLVTNPNTGATSLWTTQDGGATFTRLGP